MSKTTLNPQPTPEEIPAARSLLSKLTPGALPLDIFIEIARLTVTPTVEVVPLRANEDGEIEVLLTERGADDPVWGGMLHTPGTVVRASDQKPNNEDAFERILDGELGGTKLSEPKYVYNLFHHVKRGAEQAQVFYVEVSGNPSNGQFYSANNLPKNVVDSQLAFINAAVECFRAQAQN